MPGALATVFQWQPLESAVVAQVDLAIRAHGCAIGAAAGPCHHLGAAVWFDAGQGAALDFHEQHISIGQGNRALGKAKP
jgi:hypothetical protein